VSEGGYIGMLNVARKSMKLYFMRKPQTDPDSKKVDIIEVDLAKLFNDSKAGNLKTGFGLSAGMRHNPTGT